MDRINIPERLDPSTLTGDAEPADYSGLKRQRRPQKTKAPTPVPPEDHESDDEASHQLDELA